MAWHMHYVRYSHDLNVVPRPSALWGGMGINIQRPSLLFTFTGLMSIVVLALAAMTRSNGMGIAWVGILGMQRGIQIRFAVLV